MISNEEKQELINLNEQLRKEHALDVIELETLYKEIQIKKNKMRDREERINYITDKIIN